MHCMNCGQKVISENIEVCVACGRSTGHITPQTMREKVVSQEKAMQQEKERIKNEIVEQLTDSGGDWEKKMEYIYEPMDVLDGIISDYTKKITNEYSYEPIYRVDDTLLNSLNPNENEEIFEKNKKVEIENINSPINNNEEEIPSTIIIKNENAVPQIVEKRPINDIPHLYVVSAEEDVTIQEEFNSPKEEIAQLVEEMQANTKTEEDKSDDDVKEYVVNKTNPPQPPQPPPWQGQAPQPQQQQPLQPPPWQGQAPQPQQQQPPQPPPWQGQAPQPPPWQGQAPQPQQPQQPQYNNGKVQSLHPSQLPQPKGNGFQNTNPANPTNPTNPTNNNKGMTDFSAQNPPIIDNTTKMNSNSSSPVKVFFLSFISFSMLFAVCIGVFMLIPRDFKIENGILVEYTGRDIVVQIPNKVDKIGDGVFENLSFIEEIIIPETVTSIGNSAFANCTSLKNVEFPESIVYFGDDAVSGVPMFAGFTFEGSKLVEYSGDEVNVVIPNFVTTIGTQAFFNNDIVKTITLPSGLRKIEEVAFSSCDALESIVIPDGTTTILNSAFSGCDSLGKVSIPATVTFIGSDSFSGTPWYNNLSDEFNIFGNNILIKYVGDKTDVTIPEQVTLIGNAAFRNNETIKTVTIPSRTKEIGYQAFSGCSALESVVISEGVTTISEGAFLGCFSIKKIDFPSTIMSIKRMSLRSTHWYQNFYDKFGIVGDATLVSYMGDEVVFEIPSNVKHITDEAFASNILIEGIIIPNSVVYIDDYAFAELELLEKVYCVENSYADKFFKANDSLSHVTIVYS